MKRFKMNKILQILFILLFGFGIFCIYLGCNNVRTIYFSYKEESNIKYNGDIFSGSRDIGPWFGIHDLYFYGTMNDLYSYKYSGQCAFLDGHGLVDRTNIDNSIGVKEVELAQIIFRE